MIARDKVNLAPRDHTGVQRRQNGNKLGTDLAIVSPPEVEQVAQDKDPLPVFRLKKLYQQVLIWILQTAKVHIGEQQIHAPPYPAHTGCGG